MIFCVTACCCARTFRLGRTEAACRPTVAAVWTTSTLTAVGPDIRVCCLEMVAAEGCRHSALDGEPSLRKTNVHLKFYTI